MPAVSATSIVESTVTLNTRIWDSDVLDAWFATPSRICPTLFTEMQQSRKTEMTTIRYGPRLMPLLRLLIIP